MAIKRSGPTTFNAVLSVRESSYPIASPTSGINISVAANRSAELSQRERRRGSESLFIVLLLIPKLSETLKLSNPNGSKNMSKLIIMKAFSFVLFHQTCSLSPSQEQYCSPIKYNMDAN
jgi:hypothetical protein